jgi:hypothetical protein
VKIIKGDHVFVKLCLPKENIFFLFPYFGVTLCMGRDVVFKGRVIGGTSSCVRPLYNYTVTASNLNGEYRGSVRGKHLQFAPSPTFTSPQQTALQFIQYNVICKVELKQQQLQLRYAYYSTPEISAPQKTFIIQEKYQAHLVDYNRNTPLLVALQQVPFQSNLFLIISMLP